MRWVLWVYILLYRGISLWCSLRSQYCICSLRSLRGERLFQTKVLSCQSPPAICLRSVRSIAVPLHCSSAPFSAPQVGLAPTARARHCSAPPSAPLQFRSIAVPLSSLFVSNRSFVGSLVCQWRSLRSRIIFARFARFQRCSLRSQIIFALFVRFQRYLAFVCGGGCCLHL